MRLRKLDTNVKKKKVYCIIGAHIKNRGKIFNSSILINRKGQIQYVYKKIHLFPGLDLKKTSSGKTNKVIKTDFGKIGIIICWDFAFPEECKYLSKNGAKIIFCPSYLMHDSEVPKKILRSYPLLRAFENNVYFISCDAFTDEVLGESYICSPFKTINQIKGREELIVSDLSL